MAIPVSPVCWDLALVTRAACQEASREASVCREGFHPCDQLLLYKTEVVCLTQARKTLILLPYIMERLQGADSDASAVALPVLGNMLQLLEGKTSSLTALALAGKLRPLFDDVRLGENPVPSSPGTSIRASHRGPCALQGDALPRSPQTPSLPLAAPCCIPNSLHGLPPAQPLCHGGDSGGRTVADVLSPTDVHPALAASPSPPQGLPLHPLAPGTPAPLGRPSVCHSSLPFGAGLSAAVLGTSVFMSTPCLPWAWG